MSGGVNPAFSGHRQNDHNFFQVCPIPEIFFSMRSLGQGHDIKHLGWDCRSLGKLVGLRKFAVFFFVKKVLKKHPWRRESRPGFTPIFRFLEFITTLGGFYWVQR